MILYGFIHSIDPATGRGRVNIPVDDFVTGPLPFLFPATSGDEYFVLPDVNTRVAVLVDGKDEHGNPAVDDGVILGAIYDAKVKPSQGAENKTYVKFKDGTTIVYDRQTHKYTVTMDTVVYEISRDGFKVKRGSETLKKIISDTLDGIIAETHTTPAGTSGPPINVATFQQIKTRLSNLLTE